jgi:hypothetical protein
MKTRACIQDILAHCAAIVIGLTAAAIPYLFNHRFYFNDDQQNFDYPYFLEIGRQLHHHHWPFLSLAIFNGGNFSIDWQLTVFNPISALWYWSLYGARNLNTLGLSIFGFYIVLIALAAYHLARSFKLSRSLSLVAATAVSTNNYLLYFYADGATWGLFSLCWLLWAWGSLHAYRTSGRAVSLAFFAVFAYLTITSGHPHTGLMLAILILGYLIELLGAKAGPLKPVSLVLVGFAVLLLALPTLLPAFFSFGWFHRLDAFASVNGLFVPNAGDVLNLSSLFHPLRMRVLNSLITPMPWAYLAWFVWPLIPLFRRERIWPLLSRYPALLTFMAFAFIMLFSPEQLGPLRFPIRFLPFFHVAVIIAFLIVLNQAAAVAITRRRVLISVAVILICHLLSLFSQPHLLTLQVLGLALCLPLTLCAVTMAYLRRPILFSSILSGGVLAGFVLTHAIFPENLILPDFLSRSSVAADKMEPILPFDGYSLYLGNRPNKPDWNDDCFYAAQGIYENRYTINGETSIGQRNFATRFMPGDYRDLWTEIRTDRGLSALFSNEPETGAGFLDLMRVNTLCVSDVHLDMKGSQIWKETRKTSFTTWYERIHPNLQHTTLSWSSPGIAATSDQPPTGERESLHVRSGPQRGFLVFARMYWPGYHAELDGQPLNVSPLAGFLVKVDVPSNCDGPLILTFVPPGLYIGFFGAAFGFILLIISLYVVHRYPPRSDTVGALSFHPLPEARSSCHD